ncbi:diguanylate cyclase [Candidatus Fermentibacterales bacterium]|nr:diguanylate cyclase [Candidatus Fermentibacterales bacterium]
MTGAEAVSLAIVDVAYEIEVMARDLYAAWAQQFRSADLRTFWDAMSRDETSHLEFWGNLREIGKTTPFSMLLDDPRGLLESLSATRDSVRRIMDDASSGIGVTKALLTAYRLEFYMLEPSFQTLFQSLRFLQSDFDPVSEYEEHIATFVDGMVRFGGGSEETGLLALTLERLWKENRSLAAHALTDSLTGVLNRRGFFSLAGQVCALMRRREASVSVLMIDLDGFKRINDTMGHAAGDEALRCAAEATAGALRESDIVSRYGGDEFVVLLPETDSVAELAGKVEEAIDRALGTRFGTGATIGSATGRIDCDEVMGCLERLVAEADSGLYRIRAGSSG